MIHSGIIYTTLPSILPTQICDSPWSCNQATLLHSEVLLLSSMRTTYTSTSSVRWNRRLLMNAAELVKCNEVPLHSAFLETQMLTKKRYEQSETETFVLSEWHIIDISFFTVMLYKNLSWMLLCLRGLSNYCHHFTLYDLFLSQAFHHRQF